MTTYEKLCKDMKQLGEHFGLDHEVIPMQSYKFKDGEKKEERIREMRITFRNPATQISYQYSIVPRMWGQLQNDNGEYERFYSYLIEAIQRNLFPVSKGPNDPFRSYLCGIWA